LCKVAVQLIHKTRNQRIGSFLHDRCLLDRPVDDGEVSVSTHAKALQLPSRAIAVEAIYADPKLTVHQADGAVATGRNLR